MIRLAGASLALLSLSLCGQVAQDANAGYKTTEGRAALAKGLTNPGRDGLQRPKDLVTALGVEKGWTVVDLGTGPGYMLPFLGEAVGSGGKVVAEDIQTDFLDKARERAKAAGLGNVEFVLGTERDPRLTPGSADLILVLDSYHHFDYPERMLASLREALKPGGRLAIVEYHKKRGAMGAGDPDRPLKHIRASAEEVEKEVVAGGFRLLWRRDHIPESQYIAMFQR